MTPTFGPATQLVQGITLAVVLALTTLVVMLSEPDRAPALSALPPSLSALAAAEPATPVDVRVQMRRSVDPSDAAAAVRRAGGIPLGRVATDLRARMSAASAVALSRRPVVRGVIVLTR